MCSKAYYLFSNDFHFFRFAVMRVNEEAEKEEDDGLDICLNNPGTDTLHSIQSLVYRYLPVLLTRILIRIRIHMFLGLLDPDPLVRGMDPDPDPDPSITKQK
jgi:hypothetical protein